ncbi:MAG: hypothetical protein ACXAC8_13035 [Candidatus Hodarchaeales archaeon]|jgi:hypothetical protein
MLPEYVSIQGENSHQKEKTHLLWNDSIMKSKKVELKAVGIEKEQEMTNLADRALLLLSFKDTSTQNLRYVLNVLGIRTSEEKKKILHEIFRLIREGIVYVPRGLPQLIDQGWRFDFDNSDEIESIDLCLLRPYDQLIKEIQKEVSKIHVKQEKDI